MSNLGLHDVSLIIAQHNNTILQQQSQTSDPVDVTDGPQAAAHYPQQEPIVRSPTSTLAAEDSNFKLDAAALAAAYRARIALAAASPAPSAAPSNQPRGTPAARLLTFVNSPLPTPTVHGNDQGSVQILERKWKSLYGSLRGNSQAAADVLMKQAQATSQLEELVQALLMQLKAGTEDRVRLQQQLLQERTQLMAHAEEAQHLQQRLHKSEHRSTAVQVVTETLQGQLSQTREALEASNRERQQLAGQVKQMSEQLAVTTECRTRGDALISEQKAIIDTLRQQLEEQASAVSNLAEDKAALEAQLQGVLRAEQELTVHLRETHAAIEGQLTALRDQLKAERQKRAVVVKKRGELQAQVEALQAQLAAQQADMAALTDRLARGGASHPASSRAASAASHHPAAPSAAKPSGHAGVHPRAPTSVAGAAHAAHGRGSAAGAGSQASAAAGAHQRPRSALRSSAAAPSNPRLTSHSPTTSGSAGRAAAQRRTSSPAGGGSEDASGAASAAAVTLHVPSTLPSPEASFGGTPVPVIACGEADGAGSPGQDGTPLAAVGRTRSGGRAGFAMEPPSPPIALAPISARENAGLHAEPSSAGANRRRSLSPEASSSRASANATQHARRVVSAAGRPAGGRATSPAPAAGSAWLP